MGINPETDYYISGVIDCHVANISITLLSLVIWQIGTCLMIPDYDILTHVIWILIQNTIINTDNVITYENWKIFLKILKILEFIFPKPYNLNTSNVIWKLPCRREYPIRFWANHWAISCIMLEKIIIKIDFQLNSLNSLC